LAGETTRSRRQFVSLTKERVRELPGKGEASSETLISGPQEGGGGVKGETSIAGELRSQQALTKVEGKSGGIGS